MAKGMYYYLREAWKKPSYEMLKQKLVAWRKSNAIVRLEHPTRLDKARALGYKAKSGFIVVRVRVMRGGRTKTRPSKKGRRSKRQSPRKTLRMNYRWVAEAGVIGKPDPEGIRGDIIKAFVVLTEGHTPSDALKKELQEFVKKHTAPYKYPRKIKFVKDLPKTISGKIKRKELKMREFLPDSI